MDYEDKIVSVIVPVYNAQKYLKECVNSIINQTYKNLDIIIIDDGSIDESPRICSKLKELDDRIVYFHNINHGVGYTRNYGVIKARGDYIAFVDSDDICDSRMIETLVGQFSECDVQLVVSGINVFITNPNETIRKESVTKGVRGIDEYLKTILLNVSTGHVCGAPYAKLYKRSIIMNNGIRFNEELTYGEDFCFNMDYLKHTKSIIVLDKAYYYYRENNSKSLTYKNNHTTDVSNFWNQRKTVYSSYESVFTSFASDEVIMRRVQSLLMDYVISTVKLVSRDKSLGVGAINEWINNDFVTSRITYSDISVPKKIRIFLIKYKMYAILFAWEKIRYFFARLFIKF